MCDVSVLACKRFVTPISQDRPTLVKQEKSFNIAIFAFQEALLQAMSRSESLEKIDNRTPESATGGPKVTRGTGMVPALPDWDARDWCGLLDTPSRTPFGRSPHSPAIRPSPVRTCTRRTPVGALMGRHFGEDIHTVHSGNDE